MSLRPGARTKPRRPVRPDRWYGCCCWDLGFQRWHCRPGCQGAADADADASQMIARRSSLVLTPTGDVQAKPRQHLVPAVISLLQTIEVDVSSHQARLDFKEEGAIQLALFGKQNVMVPREREINGSLSGIAAWLLGEILAQHRPQRLS